MDALAELRALVPGAAHPLSTLIRAIITAYHGGGAEVMAPSAVPPPGSRTAGPAPRRAASHEPAPLTPPPSADDTAPWHFKGPSEENRPHRGRFFLS